MRTLTLRQLFTMVMMIMLLIVANLILWTMLGFVSSGELCMYIWHKMLHPALLMQSLGIVRHLTKKNVFVN